MYTSHHACWDAKNRYGLPEEVPFSYASIAQVIEEGKSRIISCPSQNCGRRKETGRTKASGDGSGTCQAERTDGTDDNAADNGIHTSED